MHVDGLTPHPMPLANTEHRPTSYIQTLIGKKFTVEVKVCREGKESSFRCAQVLSKPEHKSTHVSLAPGVIPGPSSGVRGTTPLNTRIGGARLTIATDRWLLRFTWITGCLGHSQGSDVIHSTKLHYLPVGSFTMSLDNSNDLNIPDADSVDRALEAAVLPKFDMHLYKSSLTKTHVKWLVKCYGISVELHPRVVPEGMTMDRLPDDAIGFVADPFPKPEEFNESDVEKLREVVITLNKPAPSLLYVDGLSRTWKDARHVLILKGPKGKVLTMAEFLRLPNF
ncbi:hypothetical protein Tco_0670894 [Tanacetum coccineum]